MASWGASGSQGVGGYTLLARAPDAQRDITMKLERFFSSRWMSGGGECEVTMLDRQTYRVIFQDEDDQRRVLQRRTHVIETTTVTVHEEGQEGPEGHHRKQEASGMFTLYEAQLPVSKILVPVTVTLYNEKMTDTIREEIKERFSQLIKYKRECIELTGSFHEMNPVWDYLRMRLGTGMVDSLESQSRDARQSFSRRGRGTQMKNLIESEIGEEVPSFSLRGGARKGVFTDTLCVQTLPKSEEVLLSVPSASGEYVIEIYQSHIEDIQRRYKVKFHHSTSGDTMYIQVIPQGGDSLVDLAKQEFCSMVKDAMGDWSQEIADSSRTRLPLAEIKQIVKSQWDKVLVITQDGRFILRGPKDQITQAKMFLEKRETDFPEVGTSRFTRHRIPVPLPIREERDTEIPRHLDILSNLKSWQIFSIESSSAKQTKDDDDQCPICLSENTEKEVLPKCKHAFCRECLQKAMSYRPVCPICAMPYEEIRGNQPDGTMRDQTHRYDLPGYPGCGTIEISYSIPDGIQKANHPHPGKRFRGFHRIAYLPNNQEGREILRLLRKAFDRRLIFTIGESRITGSTDTVTWNDIHHKTSTFGGTANFGYPDPDYLECVREELKEKGIE